MRLPRASERVRLDQLVDDGLVGRALLALGVEDLQAGEEGHVLGEGRVLEDVVGHPVDEAVPDEELVVVGAVAGRHVDEAGAGVVGDEVAFEQRDVVVPVARRASREADGAASTPRERRRTHRRDPLDSRRRGRLSSLRRRAVGEDERSPGFAQLSCGRRCHLDRGRRRSAGVGDAAI